MVYEIIKELGGIATLRQIKKIAKERYPRKTLYQYVWIKLILLEHKQVIEGEYFPTNPRANRYKIIAPYE